MERKTQRNEFGLPNIVIPAEVLFNPELTKSEMILFGFLNNLCYNEHGHCWSGNRYLSRLINVTPETVSTMLSKLNKLDYLRLEYYTDYHGNNIRKIFINPNYPKIYTDQLKEQFQKLKAPTRKIINPRKENHNGNKENLNTPKVNDEDPPSKTLTNIDMDIDNNIVLSDPEESDSKNKNVSDMERDNKKPSTHERAKQFLPQVEILAEIIQSTKNVKINLSKKKAWANEIRKLVETDGVDPSRVDAALEWYQENAGGEYIPVIESGASLRSKFIKLENAIERSGFQLKEGSTQITPDQVDDKVIQKVLTERPELGNGNFRRLKNSIDRFKEWHDKVTAYHKDGIDVLHDPEAGNHQSAAYHDHYAFYNQLSTPELFLERYLEWLGEQRWLDCPSANMFSPDHKVFEQFKGFFADYIVGTTKNELFRINQ